MSVSIVARSRPRQPGHRRRWRRLAIRTLGLVILLAFALFPLWSMVSMSLKPPAEQMAVPPTLLPLSPTIDNYTRAIGESSFARYFLNSIVISTATTILVLILALLGSFGFTRYSFRGRRLLLNVVILGQLVPLAAIAVPLHGMAVELGLVDSYVGLILAYLGIATPVGVWLMRGYLASVPRELEEAAIVDGCSRPGAFIRIVLPLIRPGIAATAVFVFFVIWQEFLFALVFLTSNDKRTLPLGLQAFIGQFHVDWGPLTAVAVIIVVPAMIVFAAMQRGLVSGLVEGGVKQ